MMLRFLPLVFLLPACVMASQAEPEAIRLIKSCNELVAMYDRDGQENKLTSWFGSVSEGMLAGYCRGVIIEFRRANELRVAEYSPNRKRCNEPDWFKQAQRIASYSVTSENDYSVGDILEASCGI